MNRPLRLLALVASCLPAACATSPSVESGDGAVRPDAAVPPTDAPVVRVDSSVPGFAPAPDLGDVTVAQGRSSVRLTLPAVDGARDYRVFALEPGVTATTDAEGREHVQGATIFCAGIRPRNQCNGDEASTTHYGNDLLDITPCTRGEVPNVPTEVMRTVEVDGLAPGSTLVVEALDRLCPFPGLYGTEHRDIEINSNDIVPVRTDGQPRTVDVVVDDVPRTLQLWQETFPVRTEAEIRAQYGSMIFNGQGPNLATSDRSSPAYPESPYIRIAQPAELDDPRVLGRAMLVASPLGTETLPEGFTESDFFVDFDDADPVTFVGARGYLPTTLQAADADGMRLYQTSEMNVFMDHDIDSDVFVDRGQLHMMLGDPAQGSMTTQAMYPRRPAHLPSAADRYLHVTYEVAHDETPRRYAQITFCGSDVPGQTYDGDHPRSAPIPRPGFMNEGETARTSPLGWNCLYVTPRGAGYWSLPGGDVESHSDTRAVVTTIASHPAVTDQHDYDYVRITPSARQWGPTQEDPFPRSWSRTVGDATDAPVGPWLDDHLAHWLRTHFDVYVRRDRVVIYVDGEQRLCADFAGAPLTMSDVAIGFWHVLYHSSAEFLEIRRDLPSDHPQTGQHHILRNTPFADEINWDNLGFREDVTLPADFDVRRCR